MRYPDPVSPQQGKDGLLLRTTNHHTPRMGNRPDDPAYELLTDDYESTQKVFRKGCYICEDREFARMGMPLCNRCCQCAAGGKNGHIAADDGQCDDCEHDLCQACFDLSSQEEGPQGEEICTCDTPCCEVNVGVGIMTCGGQHCPTHGETESEPGWSA